MERKMNYGYEIPSEFVNSHCLNTVVFNFSGNKTIFY
jgi:hypothetical protein